MLHSDSEGEDDNNDDAHDHGDFRHHGLDRILAARSRGRVVGGTVKAFAGKTVGQPDLDSGDKIVLHGLYLMATLQLEDRFPWPLAFRLTNKANGKVIHAGVQDFTSSDKSVCCFCGFLFAYLTNSFFVGTEKVAHVPEWIMKFLEIGDGDELSLRTVNLPKGTFCQLQPPVCSYQTLTEGTVVQVQHEGRALSFLVTETRPAPGISIIDTDMATDIMEPKATPGYTPTGQGGAAGAEGTAAMAAVASAAGGRPLEIVLGQEHKGTVPADGHVFFTLHGANGAALPARLAVHVRSVRGCADVYASRHVRLPTAQQYGACDQHEGDKVLVITSDTLPGWSDNRPSLHLGIYFYSFFVGGILF
jgi:hypothetical protein